jgi:hypothetical protein
MTTPDHRPYLTATDLRTPEDVLAWLGACEYWFTTGASLALAARLDRERRQACRRAALLEWRRVCELVRWCDAYRNSDAAWHEVAPSLWRTLARALAFRAAARQP